MQAPSPSAPWWPSWRNPHPVPNRDEPNAGLETKDRQKREREITNQINRLNKKLGDLTVQSTRARSRMESLQGEPEAHARAAVKFVKLLNEQIDVKEKIEGIRVLQEVP